MLPYRELTIMSIILLMVFYKASYLNIHHSVFVSKKDLHKTERVGGYKSFYKHKIRGDKLP